MITMRTSFSRRSNSNTDALVLAPLAIGLLVCGLLVAQPARAADEADTAKLWTKHCQSCHGADGKGKTKAGEKSKVRDLSAADVKAKLTNEKAVAAIKDGVKEEGSDKFSMKPYADKLSAAEIDALAAHSLSFK